MSRLLVACASVYRSHHAIEVKAAGLLAWWNIPETLQPFAHIGAGGCERKHVVHPPFVVAYAFMLRAFKWVHAQVRQHRCTLHLEWLAPDINSFGVLLQERDLPVVVAQRRDLTVVGPVEKFVARPLGFSLQRRQQVLAVQMDFVGHVADRTAFQQILFHVWIARSGEQCG